MTDVKSVSEMNDSSQSDRVGRLLPLAGLALMAVLRPLDGVWLIAAVLAGFYLVLPGLLLLRAVGAESSSVRRFPLYVPAASILVLYAGGLLADLLGPLIGLARPLHGDATALTGLVVCVGLWLTGLRHPSSVRLPWSRLLRLSNVPLVLPLPCLAAAGALLLNNTGDSALAAVTAVLLPIVLFACVLRGERLSRTSTALIIFSLALAAEWAFSLRSHEIFGYDISTEVGLAQRVHSAGIWHLKNVGNAYGAMLSLTVLPSTLLSATGISPLILMKVVYPIITALLPVAIFLICGWFARRRAAIMAAGLLLVQYYFFQQLAEVARQEIGLLFFAAIVALLLDFAGDGRRLTMMGLFAAGLVLSHYSSTYFGIIFLGLSLLLWLFLTPWRARRTGVTWLLVTGLVVLGGGAGVYYGPITRSASNISSFVHGIEKGGLKLFPASKGGLIKAYVSENIGYEVSGAQFERLARATEAPRARYVHPLRQAFERRYTLRSAGVPETPVRLGAVARLLNAFAPAFGELMLLGVGVGALVALFGGDRRRRVGGVFGVSMIVVLLVFRFSATFAAQYNQTRALLQALIVLAIPAAILFDRALGWLPRAVTVSVALALGLMFALQDGATWLAVGGGYPVNLANRGEAYERFYETPAELAGAQWTTDASRRHLVFSDEYGALRFQASSGLFPLQPLTPVTIDGRGWIYGTRTNVRLGRARGSIESRSATYVFPADFLNAYYDTVFNDGDTKVWHR